MDVSAYERRKEMFRDVFNFYEEFGKPREVGLVNEDFYTKAADIMSATSKKYSNSLCNKLLVSCYEELYVKK